MLDQQKLRLLSVICFICVGPQAQGLEFYPDSPAALFSIVPLATTNTLAMSGSSAIGAPLSASSATTNIPTAPFGTSSGSTLFYLRIALEDKPMGPEDLRLLKEDLIQHYASNGEKTSSTLASFVDTIKAFGLKNDIDSINRLSTEQTIDEILSEVKKISILNSTSFSE